MIHRMKPCLAPAAFLLGTLGLASICAPALAAYVPDGSYGASCREIRVDGPYLSALCARVDGSWHPTHIFVPRRGGSGISNQNGYLSCGG